MGLYRATLNQPEARAGQTAWFDDKSRDVRKRVLHGHLVPVDEQAKAAQTEVVTVEAGEETVSPQERIQQALAAAREREAAKGTLAPAEVSTAVTASVPVPIEKDEDKLPEVEPAEEEVAAPVVKPAPRPTPKPKRRSS